MDSTQIGLVAAVISTAAAVIGVAVTWRLARRAEELTHRAIFLDWRRDLCEWAVEVINVLGDAEYAYAALTSGEQTDTLRRCKHRLSILVDRGRFFFENVRVHDVGTNKPSAYQGYRHPVLNPLMSAYRVLNGEVKRSKFYTRKEALYAIRREFVSQIQKIVIPEELNRRIVGNDQNAKTIPPGEYEFLRGDIEWPDLPSEIDQPR